MKKYSAVLLAVALVGAALPAFAAETRDHASKNVIADGAQAAPDAAWLAKARADYPLETCVVSGDKIGGDMGGAIDYVYRQAGKPDRLVRFCCKMCVSTFEKDPAAFLAKIDAAAAAKAKKP